MLSTTTGKHYTAEMQMLIHDQAKAAWHITLVMSQVFHFWLCTTRRISVFKHGTQNIAAVLALLIEIFILNFMIYMPGVQHWLSVTHPPAFVWLFCLPVGIILIIFNEENYYFRGKNFFILIKEKKRRKGKRCHDKVRLGNGSLDAIQPVILYEH
ncbi:Cation transporting ATPase C-terminus family protein [Brugia pahangi]